MISKKVVIVLLVSFSCITMAQPFKIESLKPYSYSAYDKSILNSIDSAILKGNIDEYEWFHTDCANNILPITNELVLYSFIMAEVYGYSGAAYNCFFYMGGLDDTPKDSVLTQVLLHLLEIGASCDSADAYMGHVICAKHLSIWYGGREFVKPDPEKQVYYQEKYQAFRRSWERKKNRIEKNDK